MFSTDLIDGATVTEQNFTFHASALYGGDACELEVTCNGILLNGDNGTYIAGLSYGENTVRIKASSGNHSETRSYKITYRADFTIETDIDEAEIYNDVLEFSANATFNDATCAFTVDHNGEVLPVSGSKYVATLINGENIFVITARFGDLTERREWRVLYEGFTLITNLSDYDTGDGACVFRAAAKYGESSCELKVDVNGKDVQPDGNKYKIELVEGENIITLTASEGNAVKQYSYTVRYFDAPPVISTSISDGKICRGSRYGFDVFAKDGLGEKLAASCILFQVDWTANDGIEQFVPLNGISRVWDDTTMTSFLINFKSSPFSSHIQTPFILRIAVQDGFSRQSSVDYTLTYIPAEDGEEIGRAVFSLEGFTINCGYFVEPIWVPIYEGVNFAKTLTDIILENGWTYSNTGTVASGFYLSSISGLDLAGNMIADGIWERVQSNYTRSIAYNSVLGEFCYGSGSGWMYSVNGIFKNYCFSDYYPQDGDVVRVQFTLALGADIGGGGAMGGGSSASWLDDNPDYAPIMKLLADIASDDNLDKTVYGEVINSVSKWNISQRLMDEQLLKLSSAYGRTA